MRALVTGATGFLGARVVRALADRGHDVRAVVRPASDVARLAWPGSVEIYRADLRGQDDLSPAFESVDVLVHLAATVAGDDESRWQGTAVATERLLESMKRSKTNRLVLASSFSCYDWTKVRGQLTEETPLENRGVYERDSYAVAKLWQERLARRYADRHGWDLRVIRPGFIWGKGNEWQAGLGQPLGRHVVVIGPTARPPLTHVDNCAEAFAVVTERDEAAGQTFNMVDGHGVTSWRFVKAYQRGMNQPGWRLPIPYLVGLAIAYLAQATSRVLFGRQGKLPSILVVRRFRARFRPVDCQPDRLEEVLGWSPPFDFRECLARTFGSAQAPAGAVSRSPEGHDG